MVSDDTRSEQAFFAVKHPGSRLQTHHLRDGSLRIHPDRSEAVGRIQRAWSAERAGGYRDDAPAQQAAPTSRHERGFGSFCWESKIHPVGPTERARGGAWEISSVSRPIYLSHTERWIQVSSPRSVLGLLSALTSNDDRCHAL